MKIFLIFGVLIVNTLSTDPYDNLAFVNIGNFGQSSYYVPRYFTSKWHEARILCQDYGFDLAAFDTLDEFQAVQAMCKNNSNLFTTQVLIDGILIDPAKKYEWFLTTSGKQITYRIQYLPGEPNNLGGREYFLSLVKPDFLFNDLSNDMLVKFICEKKM